MSYSLLVTPVSVPCTVLLTQTLFKCSSFYSVWWVLDFPGRPLRETKIRQNRFAIDVVFQILSVPFVATNQYVDNAKLKKIDWVGSIPKMDIGEWVDIMLLLIFGGIPWQGYMQRILSIKNTKTAQYLSVISMVGCALMSMPSSYIGVVARWALENYKYFLIVFDFSLFNIYFFICSSELWGGTKCLHLKGTSHRKMRVTFFRLFYGI